MGAPGVKDEKRSPAVSDDAGLFAFWSQSMKFYADWGGFTSTAIFPTVLVGRGWAYVYWLQGRAGVRWR